jgi:hypothetical protein
MRFEAGAMTGEPHGMIDREVGRYRRVREGYSWKDPAQHTTQTGVNNVDGGLCAGVPSMFRCASCYWCKWFCLFNKLCAK